MSVEKYWYSSSLHPITFLLLPLSWLFGVAVALRRWLYRYGVFKVHRFSQPVIVVGNITTGGTGKTPFVIWLATWLQAQGLQPGIVSRGVGGQQHQEPHVVTNEDSAFVIGDEAVLLKQKTKCPMVICIDRAKAVARLLRDHDCNIVISDDGLQHYGLARDLEIVLIDSARGLGNQCLLPAGPLRESIARLNQVDIVIHQGDATAANHIVLQPTDFVAVNAPHTRLASTTFPHKKIHAVAGIGHPERFFSWLTQAGYDIIRHPFPDHFAYQQKDFEFEEKLPIVMTAKDAVKCTGFADERYWFVDLDAQISDSLRQKLTIFINTLHN